MKATTITHLQPKLAKSILPLIFGLAFLSLSVIMMICLAATGISINGYGEPDSIKGFAFAFAVIGFGLLGLWLD